MGGLGVRVGWLIVAPLLLPLLLSLLSLFLSIFVPLSFLS